jgi:oxygen-dependent protoporphyrinogen oxidase
MRKTAKQRRAGGGGRRRVKNLVSFRDGLDRLPAALAEKLGSRYQSATRILEIEPNEGGGFRVHAECGGETQLWFARELVIAAEADQAARWLEAFDLDLALTLRSFPYNRLAVVALGLKSNEARLPEGFGFLAPRGEGVRMLGAIVNSNFLPGRAPAGCAALTIFIGGDLDPEAADLSDGELTETVRRDLKTTAHWSGPIQSMLIERWPRAIPQYDMGHGARLTAIETAERRWRGLHLVGNWRGGVSIGDRVETTRALAEQMMNLSNLAARAGEQTKGQR